MTKFEKNIASKNTNQFFYFPSSLVQLAFHIHIVFIHGFKQLFPSLNKMVFLDDDIVIQTDLSPLWDIDMKGKVNGAVQTCRGKDEYVMSKRFKNYLNFSHPLIADNFDPQECAWAYGMNIFDLEAWRKTNISATYYHWLDQVNC